MLCIRSKNSNPYFNLAAEEYFLKHNEQDVFMLWHSDNTVVVGKHQNTLAEINYRYVKLNNIQVARRLTGGGTVFHGHGNVNFSFIKHGEIGKLVDFRHFMQPVIDFLNICGIKAIQGPKNEILVDGKKVSGNAEHVYKNRVLHHGTLLYNADLELLHESIRQFPGKYTDKAVKSIRSNVLNLSSVMSSAMSLETFNEAMMDYIISEYNGRIYMLSEQDEESIYYLVNSKYSTWLWIYGWSPDYELYNTIEADIGKIYIHLKVQKGIIMECRIESPGVWSEYFGLFSEKLKGIPHEEYKIRSLLKELFNNTVFNDQGMEEFLFGFF
jgi:lipoate-protein ligase A